MVTFETAASAATVAISVAASRSVISQPDDSSTACFGPGSTPIAFITARSDHRNGITAASASLFIVLAEHLDLARAGGIETAALAGLHLLEDEGVALRDPDRLVRAHGPGREWLRRLGERPDLGERLPDPRVIGRELDVQAGQRQHHDADAIAGAERAHPAARRLDHALALDAQADVIDDDQDGPGGDRRPVRGDVGIGGRGDGAGRSAGVADQIRRRDLASAPVDLDLEVGGAEPLGDRAAAIVDRRLDDDDVDAGAELRRRWRRRLRPSGRGGERDEADRR